MLTGTISESPRDWCVCTARTSTTESLANVVAGCITGQMIVVDGGMTVKMIYAD